MALNSKPCNQKWRNYALKTAYKVIIDPEAILRQIFAKDKTLTPLPSVFYARIYPFKRLPIMLRPRKSQKARSSYSFKDIIMHKDLQSLSSLSDKTSDVKTLSKLRAYMR
jgi:hypothetical protein